MEELKSNIEDKIQDFISNSDELKKFISFRQKHFYSYSLNNTLLIYKQMPGATFVTGYKKWQELGIDSMYTSETLNLHRAALPYH